MVNHFARIYKVTGKNGFIYVNCDNFNFFQKMQAIFAWKLNFVGKFNCFSLIQMMKLHFLGIDEMENPSNLRCTHQDQSKNYNHA